MKTVEHSSNKTHKAVSIDELLRRRNLISLGLTSFSISFLFMFSAALSAGANRQACIIHTYGVLGILAALWSIALLVSVPDFKILEKLRCRITRMTEGRRGRYLVWYISVSAYFTGLAINLVSLAGKGLPTFYFIIFYVIGLAILFFLLLEPRLMRKRRN